ncbi:hypothetical protein QYF61_010644, partial [Mycteria americana]
MVYEERLRELSKSRLGRDLIALFSYLKGGCREDNSPWRCTVHRIRGNGQKMEHGQFQLGMRKRFFNSALGEKTVYKTEKDLFNETISFSYKCK